MRTTRRALAALATAPIIAPAYAQWPERPVRIIVPFAPGGGTDIIARLVAQHLQTVTGQSFIVENRSGGSGVIGTEAVFRAAPDGLTLAMTSSGPFSILPLLQSVPYDPMTGFAHVALPAHTPLFMVVPPTSPHRGIADFIAAARANRSGMNACNVGVASPSHLAAEMFAAGFGLRFENIPHRGSAPALQDTVAGQCDVLFDSGTSSAAPVRQGQVRALGVTSPQRLPTFPDIPTIAESGKPGFQASTWSALVAPAGTPAAIVERINAETRAFVRTAAQQERLIAQGSVPLDLSPQGFTDFLRAEMDAWREVIRTANIRV
ncbi:MAG: tripartite tricarboxylate transporter substrate binding protein [Alphaproteobacteria bacterium]|nr:tripartite tricarboxylate transporter substrate binding protein [Alphaproteobacteria bacterium]